MSKSISPIDTPVLESAASLLEAHTWYNLMPGKNITLGYSLVQKAFGAELCQTYLNLSILNDKNINPP